jgi:iron complex transport system permease protein
VGFALILILIRWRINLLSLGDSEAKSLGVNVPRSRGLAIVCATILTACAVCLCGTIGRVGLIMPHLGRLLVGEDNRYLMPASALLGALFMIIVDTVARNLTGSEIPLSIITGLLGAPLFLWLLARQKTRFS